MAVGEVDHAEAVLALQTFLSTLQVEDDAPGLDDFDVDSARAAIQDLYRALGISPSAAQGILGPQGTALFQGGDLAGTLETLGINQQFVRVTETGDIYAVGPDGLTLIARGGAGVEDVARLYGIQPDEIISVTAAQIGSFGNVLPSSGSPLEGEAQQLVANVIVTISRGLTVDLSTTVTELTVIG